MDRRVAEVLRSMRERHRFIRGMVSWVGGKQVAVQYDRKARFAGETKYPLKKMVAFAIDAITSFSIVPLRLVTLLALTVIGLTILAGIAWILLFSWGNSFRSSFGASKNSAGLLLLPLMVLGAVAGTLLLPELKELLRR